MDSFKTEGLSCLAAGIEESNRAANELLLLLALAMMPPAILSCGTMVANMCLLLARKFKGIGLTIAWSLCEGSVGIL